MSGKFTLGKDEIIRGHESFGGIFEQSRKTETELLAAFVTENKVSTDRDVMVGFFISKKKFQKLTTVTGLSVC